MSLALAAAYPIACTRCTICFKPQFSLILLFLNALQRVKMNKTVAQMTNSVATTGSVFRFCGDVTGAYKTAWEETTRKIVGRMGFHRAFLVHLDVATRLHQLPRHHQHHQILRNHTRPHQVLDNHTRHHQILQGHLAQQKLKDPVLVHRTREAPTGMRSMYALIIASKTQTVHGL